MGVVCRQSQTIETKMQSALCFTKPHANVQPVQDLVRKTFVDAGIEVVQEGDISGEKIDADKLID